MKQTSPRGTFYSIYNLAGQLIYQDNITKNERTDYISVGAEPVVRMIDGVRIAYVHSNHLGSTIAESDTNGDIVWREDYTPFGEARQNPSLNSNHTGFTGHAVDAASGLTYMQARYYDPTLGRFLSKDPVGFAEGGVGYFNRYSYVMNDPVNAWDPDGKFAEKVAAYVWRNHVPSQTKEGVHLALDVGGLTPAAGIFADAANTALYAADGDLVNSALSAAAMVPAVGQGVTAAKLGAKHAGGVADFVADASGNVAAKSQSQMAEGFDAAGFPSKPTRSPGTEYTLPDGTSARLMEPSGQAGRRASFENANGGPISPFGGQPVQPPAGMTPSQRRQYVRERTHIEQDP